MSLLRLSVVRDNVYAPQVDGAFIAGPYDPDSGIGHIGSYCHSRPAAVSPLFYEHMNASIRAMTRDMPEDAPVVIMVNGFEFDPTNPDLDDAHKREPMKQIDNPHGRIFHFKRLPEEQAKQDKAASWPLGLGFTEEDKTGRTGLCVAFGWMSWPIATPDLWARARCYPAAIRMAEQAGWHLINTVDAIHKALPGRSIDIFCHSLGSRVTLSAMRSMLSRLNDGTLDPAVLEAVGRVIMLAGAEYRKDAGAMLNAMKKSHCGRTPEFYNFSSSSDTVLKFLAKNLGGRNEDIIGLDGMGFKRTHPRNWIDLRLNCRLLKAWVLDARGWEIRGDRRGLLNVLDHWIHFTHTDNMTLYTDILRNRDQWRIEALRDLGIPEYRGL